MIAAKSPVKTWDLGREECLKKRIVQKYTPWNREKKEAFTKENGKEFSEIKKTK